MNIFKEVKKNKQKGIFTPKNNTLDSIPFLEVLDNGVFKVNKTAYSKTYLIEDINYQIAKTEDQFAIFDRYCQFLNSLDKNLDIQLSLVNMDLREEDIDKKFYLEKQNDKFDHLREEYNNIVLKKIQEGKNNIKTSKYITVSIEDKDNNSALERFRGLDIELELNYKNIGNTIMIPLTTTERLDLLNSIYNTEDLKIKTGLKNKEEINKEYLENNFITEKDLISPSFFMDNKRELDFGFKKARTLYVNSYPTTLKDSFLADIVNSDSSLIITVNLKNMDSTESHKMLKEKITDVDMEINRRLEKGLPITLDLEFAKNNLTEFMEDLTKNNQKLFKIVTTITIFGDTVEQLNLLENNLKIITARHAITIKNLSKQQESGFNSTIPLGNNQLKVRRITTTEQLGIFIPFQSQDLDLEGKEKPLYFGLNPISKNVILFNRFENNNYNGFILGTSGSGKSFAAKREMLNVFLSTKKDTDDIIVIDPEGEYSILAESLGGEVIEISPSAQTNINVLDKPINPTLEENRIKISFILSLIESMVADTEGLTPQQKSIIDTTTRKVFLEEEFPTLVDFYNNLSENENNIARDMALSLEYYAVGSMDLFSKPTNIDLNNKFTVFNTSKMDNNIKKISMLVVLDFVWKKMLENNKKGKRTWVYLDEFHVLLNSEVSIEYLQNLYKRSRKYGGSIMSITQNISDVMEKRESRNMLSNAEFTMLLNQSPQDKIDLANLFSLSEAQVSFISNSKKGSGLILTRNSCVPFMDNFPTDNNIYKLLSTVPKYKE